MPIVSIVLTLIAVGFLLWLANAHIPMAAPVKALLNVVVVVALVLWLLYWLGVAPFGLRVR